MIQYKSIINTTQNNRDVNNNQLIEVCYFYCFTLILRTQEALADQNIRNNHLLALLA